MAKNLRIVHTAGAEAGPLHASDSNLASILGFKSVWALCTVNRKTRRLNATHYAVCLAYGRSPKWGVWLVNGRFVMLADSRTEIERIFPRLIWRRKMAQWHLSNVDDIAAERRRRLLEEEYGK